MKDGKQKDPRRVAAGKKAAETRKKKEQALHEENERLQENLDTQKLLTLGVAGAALCCTLI